MKVNIIKDFNGVYRIVPAVEVFLVWVLRGKMSDSEIQELVFDNYPKDEDRHSIEWYEANIKKVKRICEGCKKDIVGETIMPYPSVGFVCNPTCYAKVIEDLSNDVLKNLDELQKIILD